MQKATEALGCGRRETRSYMKLKNAEGAKRQIEEKLASFFFHNLRNWGTVLFCTAATQERNLIRTVPITKGNDQSR